LLVLAVSSAVSDCTDIRHNASTWYGTISLTSFILSGSTPGYTTYGGLRIDYSGSSGEQRSGTEGWEYIHIFGTLSSDLTLQLSPGAASGNIRYWWGYYASVRTGGVSKSALNQIIRTGPTLTTLSYTPGCWDALKVSSKIRGSFGIATTTMDRAYISCVLL
jgi:hypothetical protein